MSLRVAKFIPISVIVAAAVLFVTIWAAQADPEFRGMWISRFEWPNANKSTAQANIDSYLQKLTDNRFNAVIMQMRGQADTLYPSPYEPWSPIIRPAGYPVPDWDPMLYAVNAAHARGLEFHAYINTHACWQSTPGTPPDDPNHLYYQHCNASDPAHRDWLIHDQLGNPVQYEESSYVWMAPGVPDFQAYTRKQVMYVVNTYNVDGVHFDRIRAPGPEYSSDPISLARYNGEGNPANLTFDDWTRDQITRMLCDQYAQIMEVKPQMKISSAPLGLYRGDRYAQYGYPQSACGYQYGYSCVYQDAQAWLAAGAMDFIVPQIYWADGGANPDFSEILPDWLANSAGRHVYPGQTASVGITQLLSQISVTRQMGGKGNVVFSYSGINSNNFWGSYSGLSGPYAQTAAVPTMPWKTNPSMGIIIGNVTQADGVTPIVDANIKRSGSNYTALSSGDGLYSFLLVPPGTYTLTFTKQGFPVKSIGSVVVSAGGVTRVNTSLGNTAVILSNVQSAVTGPTGATITWNTSIPATSQVNFGLTNAYGNSTTLDNTLVTSHSVAITGLNPNTDYHYQALSTNGSDSGQSIDLTFRTPGPPEISSVQVSGISNGSATITWNTAAPADTVVDYGLDANYGSNIVSPAPATNHSVTLNGLNPNTTYHFRVSSHNVYGSRQSTDASFTTVAFNGYLIVDNSDEGFSTISGSWTFGTASSKYGSNYLFTYEAPGTSEASATSIARWTPDIPIAGEYDIYIWYARGTNRTTNSYWKVIGSGAPVSHRVNQEQDGNGWTYLDSVDFDTGTDGYIEMMNNTGITGTLQVVQGDAVMLVLVDDTPPVLSSVTDDKYTTSTTSLHATVLGYDSESAVEYYYAIGTTPGGSDIADWTANGISTSVDATGLNLTVGQTYYVSAYCVNYYGLMSDTLTSDGVTVAIPVSSIAALKNHPDSTAVSLPSFPVSVVRPSFGYIQEARISGVRVEGSTNMVVDELSQVAGILSTSGCERVLTDTKINHEGSSSHVSPLTILGRSLGGEAFSQYTPGVTGGVGLNNLGLLVKVIGTVTSVFADGFTVDDASGLNDGNGHAGVRVFTSEAPIIAPGSLVSVQGVSSCVIVDADVHPAIIAASFQTF